MELLGSAHSHPTSEAVPSASDRRLSALPALMVILGAGSQDQGVDQALPLLGWWILEPPARPQRLPWTMES